MLFLLAICFLIVPQQAFTRKQQSGFLDPFPTGNHQVAHEVPPKLNKGFREGYKSQKDSACKKLLTYTDGEDKPAFEDVCRMLVIALKLQQQVLGTKMITQRMKPSSLFSKKQNRLSSAIPKTNVGNVHQKVNRGSFFTRTTGLKSNLQNKENYQILKGTGESFKEAHGMEQKKKKISPDNTVRVRDPAKEIFGLVRDRDRDGQRHYQPNVYGSVRMYSLSKNNQPNSYFDVLKQKLMGKSPPGPDSGEVVYGKVRQFYSETPPSWFNTVQGMITNTNPNHHPESGTFDIVREKLLNLRQRHMYINH